jgi:hypothetical protein
LLLDALSKKYSSALVGISGDSFFIHFKFLVRY